MNKVTKKTKAEQTSLAYLDDLTGLYNRRYLTTSEKTLKELQEKGVPYSVVIVDIDHFKKINDTYGHIKGDEVIKEFAQFLRTNLRTTDTVVRYGGDEFVCIMVETAPADVRQVYNRILERCRQQRFSGLEVMVSAGIASYPVDGYDFNELLRIADESLYDAKRSGRGRLGALKKKRIELPTKVYIGRDEALDILNKFITGADGTAKVGIIEGNIGIGKTRLVKEALNNIVNFEVLWSDCLAFFEGIPYYPIRELIKYKLSHQGKRLLKDIPLAYRIELGKLVPELMEEIKERVSEIGLVLDKYRLYESIRQIIELGRNKKVVVIDNMQWIDRETTEIIKYLLRSLSNRPITFLFIYRREEKTAVLDELTSSISRDTNVKKLSLEALEHHEIKKMIKLIINDEPGKELEKYVEQVSGGNPFYIEEIIKGLSEAGHLKLDGDQWQFENPTGEIIPKSVEDITERKYQGLSKEGQEILEIASVIGSFDIDLLKGATGYNEGHIIGMIENIKHLGLIREYDEHIEFQDELSRNTIYQHKVAGIKGRVLHKKIGDLLELKYQGREHEVIEPLALHYYQGMEKVRGVRYCLEAGDRAKEKYAHSSALKYYTWALELLADQLDPDGKVKRIDCLLKRADVLSFIGDNEQALKELDDGLKTAREIGDKKHEVELNFRKVAIYVNISQFTNAIDEANRCIKIYEEILDKKGTAKVLNAIGNTQGFLGEYAKAFKSYETSLKICRETGDKFFEARLLNNIGLTFMNVGDQKRALKYYRDALRVKGESGDKYLEGAVLNNTSLIYASMGEYKKAFKEYEDALKIFREIGNKYGEALVLNNIGLIYVDWGEYTKGLRFAEDSLKIANDTENRYCQGLALNTIGTVHMNLGDYDRARKYFDDSLKVAEKTKSNEQYFNFLLALGNFYLMTDDLDQAKERLDEAYTKAQELKSKMFLRDALLGLGNFYLVSQELEKFAATVDTLDKLSKELKTRKFDAYINLLLGRYYTGIKHFANGHKHLQKALLIFEEMKEPLNNGIVYYYLGMLELVRKNKAAYQKYSKKASAIFSGLNAKGWLEKTKGLQKKL